MTQISFEFPRIGRLYWRKYYHLNKKRRRAQRLASKYGCPEAWRLWLA
jgi:hypothetical protein